MFQIFGNLDLTFNVYASSQLVVAACVDLEITEISHLCLSGDVGWLSSGVMLEVNFAFYSVAICFQFCD